MSFGPNTNPNPLLIEDARRAQHVASEKQRDHAEQLGAAYDAVANAEYHYRKALTARIKELRAEGWAATTCDNIARGEDPIATLRRERDQAEGALEELKQIAYRLAADRRAVDGLMDWSMRRELRHDVEPADWRQQQTFGRRPAESTDEPDFDPETGELREAA